MSNTAFKIDVNTIDTTKNKMINSYDELIKMLDEYSKMIESTEDIYKTDSGTLYREVATIYVELIKKYMNNDLKEYINSLDTVKDKYTALCNSINDMIRGENI